VTHNHSRKIGYYQTYGILQRVALWPVRERKLYVDERLPFGPPSRATGWEFNVDESETMC